MPACSRKFIVSLSAGLAVLGAVVWFSRRDHTAAPASTPARTTISQPARVKNWSAGPRTTEEIKHTAEARPCDRTVLTYLDLSRVPTQGELIAAGNLGEPLTPTRLAEATSITEPAKRARQEKDNLAFGTAIQAWNQHRYQEAYTLFEAHFLDFNDSPWTAEVQLHLGCFCQYNGRLAESADWFDKILSTVEPKSEMYNKAKLRRSILHLDQGNLEASLLGFTEMKRDDSDPQHQSYASYWIREIALLKKNETALRDCGQKALARVEEIFSAPDEARKLRETVSPGPEGFTARELHATALLHGLDSRPVHADTALDDLPVPFVAHYLDRHYVTVEQVSADVVRLFDSRVGEATMPRKSFLKQWSGFALIFSKPADTAAIHPAVNLDTIVGGCCGHPRSPADLGNDSCAKNCGMPGWSVNPVNFNFRVRDTPMWWNPPAGPDVSMSLLFNSLDSLTNYATFGAKWSFEYASYLLITPGGQVQVRDGDGRLETFTYGSAAGVYPVAHTPPAGDFRELIEIADHVFTLTRQDGTIYHYGVPPAMAGNSSVPLLLSIEDLHGNRVNITHNAQGAITSVGHSMLPATLAAPGVPSAERNWVFTYGVFNNHSRVTRIDDPFGRSATFDYDNDGNLRTQTDMGGLAYGYDYTTKLSQNSISTNLNQTTGFASPTLELFISAIHTPKGTTAILTEPSDGVTNYPVTQGYTTSYPPIGSPGMWTNYRIRITNPENKTEEYSFDGNTDGVTARAYYRNAVQLFRTTGQNFFPTSGANTAYKISVVGGIKGKITETSITGNSDGGVLSEKIFSPTLLRTTSVKGPDGKITTFEYNSNGKIKTLILPKGDVTAGAPPTDPYKIHYSYENNSVDLDKIQRYLTLNGPLETPGH